MGWWFVMVGGLGVAVANLRTMRPLWRCAGLERSQKIAQTILMWLVPGSYFLVRATVMSAGPPPVTDPTASRLSGIDWSVADYKGDFGGHHGGGNFGGGHHGGDFGGGHDGH